MTSKLDFNIELAENVINVYSIYPQVQQLCKDYLTDKKSNFSVVVTEDDIEFERRKSAEEDEKEGIHIRNFSDYYLETLAVYRKIAEEMVDFDTILFHGSGIAVDGVGYLFTAKSGTGKSTHTRLWKEYFGCRAVMINDDKPLLKITDKGVMVYGTPWDGKHHLSNNIVVPLKAICILNRDSTNHIESISPKLVYSLLLQQTYRPSDPVKMAKTLQLLDRLMEKIELYTLGCNMDQTAAIMAFEGMNMRKED